MCENRTLGANRVLMAQKELSKKDRGSFDYRSGGKVYTAIWNDNSVVGVASNYETYEPNHMIKQRSKGSEKMVTQPHLINSYNKGMGGVDLMDQ